MILWKIVYNRNFEEFYKTDWGNWKWKLLPHVKEITVGQAHKNTWKLKRNISHFPFPYFELFVLRYFPFHVVCFVLLHVFSSFFVRYLFVLPRPLMYPFSKYLRKTTVSYEIFRLSFRVFLCACPTVISSIFDKSFHFAFPYFMVICSYTLPFLQHQILDTPPLPSCCFLWWILLKIVMCCHLEHVFTCIFSLLIDKDLYE